MTSRNVSSRLLALLLIGVALTASGCGFKRQYLKLSPAEYMEYGDTWRARGREDKAVQNYLALFGHYPRDERASIAIKRSGDAYFDEKLWEPAHIQYKLFFDYYPQHPEVEEVLYRKAMSSFELRKTFDRDAGVTYRSLGEFQRLLNEYPSGTYTPLARERIAELRQDLGRFEYYVGRQYYRFSHYYAAIGRLADLPDEYPDYDELDEAYFLLGRAYEKLDAPERARESYQTLMVNFPESDLLKRTERRLEKMEE